MGDRYDALQPPNLIASIRSMPRRWTEALHVPPPKSIDDVFSVPGPAGESAAADVGAMLTLVGVLEDAIRTTSYNVAEPLGPEVASAMANTGSGAWPERADLALEQIDALMTTLAERLEALSATDWAKTAAGPSGSISLVDLVRGAVRVCAERLARASRTIASLS